ncbi:hypothetical protein EJ08DRAFT_701344 [Tothia fuscella]|uniref:DUF4470 domain-containing protein n=1 Tax=Tothia fuscella TaxID=1048955 RepID=A0A9P4NIS9_9PEZI|nr:hypothetical protein EJ08DRAFT_701344 [Tothia fuscella]
MADNGRAEELRLKGNTLYKEGKLPQAKNAYLKCMKLDPSDPSPVSNISAVRFEMGDYTRSIKYANDALGLLKVQANSENDKKISRLEQRIAKSSIFRKTSFGDQLESLVLKDPDEFHATSKLLSESNKIYSEGGREALSQVVLERIPRYRPKLQNEPEYHSVGHDSARPQFDGSLLKDQPVLTAIIFCGIGDARHLYATLARIGQYESEQKSVVNIKRHHFTLVDLKPAALARDLVLFFLLDELASVKGKDLNLMSTIFFIFMGTIMPAKAYSKFQDTVQAVIDALEDDAKMPPWLFNTKKLRALTVIHIAETTGYQDAHVANLLPSLSARGPETPEGCQKEALAHQRIGMKPSPKLTVEAKIVKYLEEHWKPNVTLVDTEWQKYRDDGGDPDMGHNPCEFPNHFYSESGIQGPINPRCFFDHFQPYFEKVVQALQTLRPRLNVEVITGEMADIFERVKHHMLDYRKHKPKNGGRPDPTIFPQFYHRIHMSNVTDYVGAHLISFLYSIPLLATDTGLYISSTCLRNTGVFTSIPHFLNEYTLLNDLATINKVFQVNLSPDSPLTLWPYQPLALGPDYMDWTRNANSQDLVLPFNKLLPRDVIEKWLHAHFLKICLPFEKISRDFTEKVESPLNLTIVFRLTAHLGCLGYPAHWLSVLESINTNSLTTSARAPRSNPVIISETKTIFPARRMCTNPFKAEMSTLTTLWHRLLPFGIICLGLPTFSQIAEYSIPFKSIYGTDHTFPNSALVFLDRKTGFPPKNLRDVLLDDEMGEHSADVKAIRQDGVHVLSTFQWDSRQKKATFWLRRDIVESVSRGNWNAYLWRTDAWVRSSEGVSMEHLVKLRAWA